MDFDIYFRFLLALVVVLALIGALAWIVRRVGFGGRLTPNKGTAPRLSVVEVRALDSRRKLVLLRRDGCEHLVLLGPSNDLLLESGIKAPREGVYPAPAQVPQAEVPEAEVPEAKRQTS
jgi:flagellar protein FliO/FliZ